MLIENQLFAQVEALEAKARYIVAKKKMVGLITRIDAVQAETNLRWSEVEHHLLPKLVAMPHDWPVMSLLLVYRDYCSRTGSDCNSGFKKERRIDCFI